jgi:hypothetical protein
MVVHVAAWICMPGARAVNLGLVLLLAHHFLRRIVGIKHCNIHLVKTRESRWYFIVVENPLTTRLRMWLAMQHIVSSQPITSRSVNPLQESHLNVLNNCATVAQVKTVFIFRRFSTLLASNAAVSTNARPASRDQREQVLYSCQV